MQLTAEMWRRCYASIKAIVTSSWLVPLIGVGLVSWTVLWLSSAGMESPLGIFHKHVTDEADDSNLVAAIRSLFLAGDGEYLEVIRSYHLADGAAEWQRLDAHTGRELQRMPLSHKRLLRMHLWGRNAAWAAVDHRGNLQASFDRQSLWDGLLPGQTEHEIIVESAVCTNPNLIAAASDLGALWILEWNETTAVVRGRYSFEEPLSELAFTAQGNRLAIATAGGKYLMWDVEQEKVIAQNAAITTDLPFVTWSDDGRRILTYDFDRMAKVWDTETGQPLREWDLKNSLVMSGVLSGDGGLAAIGAYDGIYIFNVETGKESPPITGHPGTISALQFADNGRTLFSGDHKGNVRRWSLVTDRLVWEAAYAAPSSSRE